MAFIRLEELHAARARALKAVTFPDTAYFWRKLCRWACEFLNVNIFEAEAIPVRQLLRHYYEWQFEGMDDEQRSQLVRKVIETKQEAAKRVEDEEVDEAEIDDLMAMAEEEARRAAAKRGYRFMTKEEAAKAQAAAPPPAVTKAPEPIAAPAPAPDPIPDLSGLPENVEVQFADDPPDDGWDLFGRQSSK